MHDGVCSVATWYIREYERYLLQCALQEGIIGCLAVRAKGRGDVTMTKQVLRDVDRLLKLLTGHRDRPRSSVHLSLGWDADEGLQGGGLLFGVCSLGIRWGIKRT